MTNRQNAAVAMGVGLDPSNVDVVVFNRSGGAIAPGDVVTFATTLSSAITSDGLTISTDPGSSASVFASVTKGNLGASTSLSNNSMRMVDISGVALSAAADLGTLTVRVRGITSAYVYNRANDAVAPGAHLTLGFNADAKAGYYEGGNTSTTAVNAADNCKIHGFTLESVSGTTSDGAKTKVWIDGINGFGGLN